jgi:translation initiation factor 1 (eIF-1/SUI1)
MARKDQPRDEADRGDPLREGLKHNPFARLRPQTAGDAGGEATTLPVSARPKPTASTPKSVSSPKPAPKSKSAKDSLVSAADRIVVRRERKGHGGKAVTVAEGAGLGGHDVEQTARDAAKALGVGARVEDGALVVQGEQTERLIAWLASRGFKSVVRGN